MFLRLKVILLALVLLGASGKTVYYLEFSAETFAAMTRTTIIRHKTTVDAKAWLLLQKTVRAAVVNRKAKVRPINEDKIRLVFADASGVKWVVDQSGVVESSSGARGLIDKKQLGALEKVLPSSLPK